MKHILCMIAIGYITASYWIWLLWYYMSKPFKNPIILTKEEKWILLVKLKELLAEAELNRDEWCKHK